MGVRPNVVVGALGVVVLLVTGYFLVTDWDELTGTKTIEATVSGDHKEFRIITGTLAPGAVRTQLIRVDAENVTMARFNVTWSEGGGLGAQSARVSVTLRDPEGRVIDRRSEQGGDRTLQLQNRTLATPRSSVFETTGSAYESDVAERYPGWERSVGDWTVTVDADGGSGITYYLEFGVEFFTVQFKEIPSAQEGTK